MLFFFAEIFYYTLVLGVASCIHPFRDSLESFYRGCCKCTMSYHVFLTFRGSDTRKTFTDHLYKALVQAGIQTFKDDNGIERGENIQAELENAIKESKLSIIVLSKDYASSSWCLDELVMIMKRREAARHVVLPVFYDVDPSQVRNQTGTYAVAFDRHEKFFKEEMSRVKEWRAALRKVAYLGGITSNNRHDLEFIQDIVRETRKKLCQPARNNIGRTIISRIAGIGKIAKTYNMNSKRFQGGLQNESVQELENCAVYNPKDATNDFWDSGGLQKQSVQKLKNYAVLADDTTESVNNCLRIAENIREVGTETLVTLHRQDEQITRTHNLCNDMDSDLKWGVSVTTEKHLNNLEGMSSKTWKPKNTGDHISGPLIKSDNSWKNGENNSEKREKLGLASAPKGQSAIKALHEVEAKQDDALSSLSNILDDLKSMAVDMRTEIDRQNEGLDHLHDDQDKLNSRLKGKNYRLHRRLHGK